METRSAYGSERLTSVRASIAQVVTGFSGAFTTEDLLTAARASSDAKVSTATAYRAVAAMERSGFLVRVGERAGAALWVRCADGGHHHHIVCEGCGVTAHAACPLPEVLDPLGTGGFVVTRHEVTMYGLCPQCAGTGR